MSQKYISTEYVYTLYSSIKGAPSPPNFILYLSVRQQTAIGVSLAWLRIVFQAAGHSTTLTGQTRKGFCMLQLICAQNFLRKQKGYTLEILSTVKQGRVFTPQEGYKGVCRYSVPLYSAACSSFQVAMAFLGALGTIIQCSMLILKLLVVHKGSLHYCTVQYVYNGGNGGV